MIHVKFKNLRKSPMAQQAVESRINALIHKFPDLMTSRIQVTLQMENSPFQAGPDLFKVKLRISRGRYDGVIIEKAGPHLYRAVAEVAGQMLEMLNRFGDKARVIERRKARQLARENRYAQVSDDLIAS